MWEVKRLTPADQAEARRLFALMSEIFDEPHEPLGDEPLRALLARGDVYAMAATVDGQMAGGATAYALPMTRSAAYELFLYDIAVAPAHQRRGVGRALVTTLRQAAAEAGIALMFVPADNQDLHALDFYRALGGVPSETTFFTFSDPPTSGSGVAPLG